MSTKRLLGRGASISPQKRTRFEIESVLSNLQTEFKDKCGCRKDFKLCVVLRHQLYAYFDNRTQVDRRIDELVDSGELRAIPFGPTDDQYVLVNLNEYNDFCVKNAKKVSLVERFLKQVKRSKEVAYTADQLEIIGFSKRDISELIQNGVLTLRTIVGCYYLSIPGLGEFVKYLEAGRKALILTLRRDSFKQMMRHDLEKKKLARNKITTSYLIDDAIGTDTVSAVESTTGILIRLND